MVSATGGQFCEGEQVEHLLREVDAQARTLAEPADHRLGQPGMGTALVRCVLEKIV